LHITSGTGKCQYILKKCTKSPNPNQAKHQIAKKRKNAPSYESASYAFLSGQNGFDFLCHNFIRPVDNTAKIHDLGVTHFNQQFGSCCTSEMLFSNPSL